jgi:GT2 family glycosyltransferase
VLLLNPDAVLDSSAIGALLAAAGRHPEAIGFSPKVMLQGYEGILDSVGIDLLLGSEGSQRGLGEPDVGQFDVEERIAGLCFAAALIRRSAFLDESVGGLDDRFFMFYEDVDWSMRASLQGETFWSVPSAHVQHVHSASTRAMPSAFKERLIRRNIIWTAAKNLERRRVGRVVARQTAVAILSALRSRHGLTGLRAITEAWIGMPAMLASRRVYQRRRRLSDQDVLIRGSKFGSFDTSKYGPVASVRTLVGVLSRLYVSSPNPALGALVLRLSLAQQTSAPYPGRIAQLVRESGIEISPGLEWLLQRLEASTKT